MRYCPVCERNYGGDVDVCAVDGGLLRDSGPKQDPFVGKVIKGRYRVLEKLGEGGMSVVYLAEQINVERKVALKVLHGEYARDDGFIRRFRQEAKLAASLNHRNVIQIYDFDQGEDGNLFIAMEYLVGNNLKDIICAPSLEISRAVHLAVQIADGLGAAHRAGVIHRDIKPENIMVAARGDEVKLMDFGIARLREPGESTRLTRVGMIMGTPAYMAPEQIQGNEINEKTDIYAFGIVLYEMLSRTVPFTAPTPAAVLMKHLNEIPVPLRKLRREVPSQLERIVSQALEKKPERRPANMEAIAASLRKVAREFAPTTIDKTLAVTRSLNTIDRNGIRVWLEKMLRSGKREPAAVPKTEKENKRTEVFSTSNAASGGTQPQTIVATMALTQSLESLQGRSKVWKWATLGGGALLLALLTVWAGTVWHRRVPDKETVAARPETRLPSPAPTEIVSVGIVADRPELAVKEHMELRLLARFADGTKKEINEPVQWTSSDPSVLLVGAGGRAEAKEVGKVDITARYRDVESPPITMVVIQPPLPPPPPVSAPRLVSMRIQASKTELTASEFIFLRLRGKYSDGQEREINRGIHWESSNNSIASVNSKGQVFALKDGKTQVIARADEIASAPLNLVVKSPIVARQKPEPAKAIPADKPSVEAKEPEVPKRVQPAKAPDLNEYINVARSYRERGQYARALAELKKADALDATNKEIETEIAITKRACNAEMVLGRSDLRC
jgi:serine/threonine protein kinase